MFRVVGCPVVLLSCRSSVLPVLSALHSEQTAVMRCAARKESLQNVTNVWRALRGCCDRYEGYFFAKSSKPVSVVAQIINYHTNTTLASQTIAFAGTSPVQSILGALNYSTVCCARLLVCPS